MAQHKVITTDAKIDHALQRASRGVDEPRVREVDYRAGLDLFILKISTGERLVLQREMLEGLQDASRRQLANVEVLGNGTGLHWPELNVDHYVPGLLRHVYGTKRWMATLGRRGGAATSQAKVKAARANGLKGGRPKKHLAIGA